MADAKKTTKKAVKQATVIKSLKELEKDLAAKQTDLFDARKSHRGGELVNPRVITQTRKEIARLMTAINASKKESK